MTDSPYMALLSSAETGLYNILEIEDELIRLKVTGFLVGYLKTIVLMAESDHTRGQNNVSDILMVTERFLGYQGDGGLSQFLSSEEFIFLKGIFLDMTEFVYTDVNNITSTNDEEYYYQLGQAFNKQLDELNKKRSQLEKLLTL